MLWIEECVRMLKEDLACPFEGCRSQLGNLSSESLFDLTVRSYGALKWVLLHVGAR